MEPTPLVVTSAWIASGFLACGLLLAFVRLVRGPSLPDRVVALDVMAVMAVGALVLISIATGQSLLLDVALAMALITFLGTIAFAICLERGVTR